MLGKKVTPSKVIHLLVNYQIENYILQISLVVASICIFGAGVFNLSGATSILSFYTSFVFAWLLTKKSTKEEFEREESKWKQQSHRYLNSIWENIGETTIYIDTKIEDIRKYGKYNKGVIDPILEHIQISLKQNRSGIETSMKDFDVTINKENVNTNNQKHNNKKPDTRQLKDYKNKGNNKKTG